MSDNIVNSACLAFVGFPARMPSRQVIRPFVGQTHIVGHRIGQRMTEGRYTARCRDLPQSLPGRGRIGTQNLLDPIAQTIMVRVGEKTL